MENNREEYRQHLQELSESDYVVAKGEPDIRGWKVKDSYGDALGTVKELLCDLAARKVRYLIVDLEGNTVGLQPRHVLIPVGLAEVHQAFDAVTLPYISAAQLQALPEYQRDGLTPEAETQIQQVFSGESSSGPATENAMAPTHQDYYNQSHFDKGNLYRNLKARTVIGLFPNPASLQQVTQELKSQGFPDDDIETATRRSATTPEGYPDEQYVHYFHSLLASPQEAEQHQDKVQKSHALVAVHTNTAEEANRAAHILNSARYAPTKPELDIEVEQINPAENNTDASSIPIIEESAEVGKREVETGGVLLHSQVVERPFEENLRLREERIRVERVPVDRPAQASDFKSFEEGAMELKEFAEVPVVSKEARVVEEITIGKDVEVTEETVKSTVRKTEVEVKQEKPDKPAPTPTNPSAP